jgi:hypothetical protein
VAIAAESRGGCWNHRFANVTLQSRSTRPAVPCEPSNLPAIVYRNSVPVGRCKGSDLLSRLKPLTKILVVPSGSIVPAILANASSPATGLEMAEVQALARTVGLEVVTPEVRRPEDFAPARRTRMLRSFEDAAVR